MKIPRLCLAAAACLTSLFVTGTVTAYSGAIYTSYGDGRTVNGNNYDNCEDVFLNGGPQNENAAGLPLGEYYFQVTNPSGDELYSTTPAFQRRVQVVANANGEGVIFGRAPDLDSGGYVDGNGLNHIEGSVNPENGSKPVQLWHFDPTSNNGGVYKVWLIPVDKATVIGDPETGVGLDFASRDAKTDNFKCEDDVVPPEPGFSKVTIFGHKYYDMNANGVNDGGEEWNSGDGRPDVTINITADDGPHSTTTDANGLWSFTFDVPVGDPAGSTQFHFTVCEEPVSGYDQTGPLDGDQVLNPDPIPVDPPGYYASATAAEGCWSGSITDLLGLSGLDFGNVDTVTIGGVKYYDANVSHALEGGEALIPGFKIKLEITYPDTSTATVVVTTVGDGSWSYVLPVGSSVTVSEILPSGTWVQTAPLDGDYELTDLHADRSDLDFGNVCLGPGGGLTLGFWSNKNGEKTMNDGGTLAPELALLSSLNLRTATGANFDPATYKQFRDWLLAATATNMAYMLSAQLSAMELNVEADFVSGGSIVYSPCAGFITINDLMNQANTSLGLYPNTTTPHAQRANQECLKTTIDDANNNKNFVQSSPCDVVYP